MASVADDRTLVQWLADVTKGEFALIGDALPVIPGGDFRRPTASFHKKKQEEIRIELLESGKEPRAIPDSGRTPLEDEEILRDLESRPPPPPVLHQNFDDGAWSGLSGRQMHGTASIQREVVRTGTRALQIGIKSGDKKLRAQLRDPYNAPFGEETWYGFSMRLPASFDPDKPVVLAQWCDQAETGDVSGKPPMSIRYQNGQIKFKGAGGDEVSDDPTNQPELGKIKDVPKDEWLDFRFKVVWQNSGKSKVTGFLNGKQIFEKEEQLGYPGRLKGPYFMFGLKTEKLGEGKALTAYFDNYSHGQSGDVVDPPVQPKRASKEFMDAIADPPEPEMASEEPTEAVPKKP
jgi:hypothetical protein